MKGLLNGDRWGKEDLEKAIRDYPLNEITQAKKHPKSSKGIVEELRDEDVTLLFQSQIKISLDLQLPSELLELFTTSAESVPLMNDAEFSGWYGTWELVATSCRQLVRPSQIYPGYRARKQISLVPSFLLPAALV